MIELEALNWSFQLLLYIYNMISGMSRADVKNVLLIMHLHRTISSYCFNCFSASSLLNCGVHLFFFSTFSLHSIYHLFIYRCSRSFQFLSILLVSTAVAAIE